MNSLGNKLLVLSQHWERLLSFCTKPARGVGCLHSPIHRYCPLCWPNINVLQKQTSYIWKLERQSRTLLWQQYSGQLFGRSWIKTSGMQPNLYFRGVHPVAFNSYNFEGAVNRNWMFFISTSFTTTCFGPYEPSSNGTYTSHFLGAINTTTDPLFWRFSSLFMYAVQTLFHYFLQFNFNVKIIN
jgi:hypothetical protein